MLGSNITALYNIVDPAMHQIQLLRALLSMKIRRIVRVVMGLAEGESLALGARTCAAISPRPELAAAKALLWNFQVSKMTMKATAASARTILMGIEAKEL